MLHVPWPVCWAHGGLRKRLNRSWADRFLWTPGTMHLMAVHIVAIRRIWLNYPCAAAMRPRVRLLWPLVRLFGVITAYGGRLKRDSLGRFSSPPLTCMPRKLRSFLWILGVRACGRAHSGKLSGVNLRAVDCISWYWRPGACLGRSVGVCRCPPPRPTRSAAVLGSDCSAGSLHDDWFNAARPLPQWYCEEAGSRVGRPASRHAVGTTSDRRLPSARPPARVLSSGTSGRLHRRDGRELGELAHHASRILLTALCGRQNAAAAARCT